MIIPPTLSNGTIIIYIDTSSTVTIHTTTVMLNNDDDDDDDDEDDGDGDGDESFVCASSITLKPFSPIR